MTNEADVVALGRVGFQLNAVVRGAIFNPGRPEGLRFNTGSPNHLSFTLKPSERDPHGFGYSGLNYRVRAELPASAATIEFVRALIAGRYEPFGDPPLPLPLTLNDRTVIAADGTIQEGFGLRHELAPLEVRQLLDLAEADLEGARDRFLSLLRWRQGAVAADKLVEYSSLYWRVDPGVYHIVPQRLSQPTTGRTTGKGFRWGDNHEAALSELWNRNVEEPFAHELIREAQTLLEQSPRSALLIAVSAAETGIKQHLSKVAPATAWLLEEGPSPPVDKMLRKYVPVVNAAAGRDVDFWDALKPIFSAVKCMVEARNKVAHTGRLPDGTDVQAAIDSVRDLLYVLDVVEGESWAKLLVDESLANQLDWPPREKIDRRVLLRMSQPDDEALRDMLTRSGKTRD